MSYIEIRVVDARGSAPRDPGTRMWVGAAEVHGTIGGGNLEYTALKIAREMLLSGEASRERRFPLGDSLGQCCGGNVTLSFTRVSSLPADGNEEFHVVLFGAGHVGREVARILERLPCRLTWVDSRPEQFPAETKAKVVIEDEPLFAVDDAAPGAFYLVMTHSHALDFDIVARALSRTDARFVGMIGSESKAAKCRARLQRAGVDASRLVSPIGLFKAGKHPAEVAVSAVAQLLTIGAESERRQAQVPVGGTLKGMAGP